MGKHMILYRGALKSCNYRCSYCPFSKHKGSEKELEKDRRQWLCFCESLKEKAARLDIHALLVAPYGEALLHSWYWEGLAYLSALPVMDAVGAQTNLSFSLKESLVSFVQMGGRVEKLRLWATFHPEMVRAADFAEKCQEVLAAGISLCVGAVGVPENIDLLRQLRKALPEEIYLWINKMDGLRRPYTKEEQEAFGKIDPFFYRELEVIRADAAQCAGRLFVESDGSLKSCNISPPMETNWYDLQDTLPEPLCRRKRCSCFLAYGGRADLAERGAFGAYPLFRIWQEGLCPSPDDFKKEADKGMALKSEKSIELYHMLLERGYPEVFCDQVTKNLDTDWTAQRMMGYLAHYKKLPMEEVADEMLSILSDRSRIMEKKELERVNASWNSYLNRE